MAVYQHPKASAFGQNVRDYDGAKLYFYETGTTTDKTTYTTSALSVAHTQPVVADGNGVFPAIFLTGSYKVVLQDKNDVVQWTVDGVQGEVGEFIWKGDFDSSTNSGDYPATGSQGEIYRVSTGFTLNPASGSHVLNTFDFIVCNKDSATGIDADWNILRGVNTVIDEDSFATNSTSRAPSQQSVLAYLANQSYWTYKGQIDCSTNPNYPAANAGDSYEVSVAGRIGGVSGALVDEGDRLLCKVDSSASGTEAAVGTNWNIGQGKTVTTSFQKSTDLYIKNNATNPLFQVDITATQLNIEGYLSSSVSLTADVTASGANGLDTGAEANSTWYHIWAIYNIGTGSTASLLSVQYPGSGVEPTLPSGYTKKLYLGAVYNLAGGDFRLFEQKYNKVMIPHTSMFSGVTSTSWTGSDISSLVPQTVTQLDGNFVSTSFSFYFISGATTPGATDIGGSKEYLAANSYTNLSVNMASQTIYARVASAGSLSGELANYSINLG